VENPPVNPSSENAELQWHSLTDPANDTRNNADQKKRLETRRYRYWGCCPIFLPRLKVVSNKLPAKPSAPLPSVSPRKEPAPGGSPSNLCDQQTGGKSSVRACSTAESAKKADAGPIMSPPVAQYTSGSQTPRADELAVRATLGTSGTLSLLNFVIWAVAIKFLPPAIFFGVALSMLFFWAGFVFAVIALIALICVVIKRLVTKPCQTPGGLTGGEGTSGAQLLYAVGRGTTPPRKKVYERSPDQIATRAMRLSKTARSDANA
jgi:hypothetical protein